MPLFEGVTDDGVLADVDATLDHLDGAGLRALDASASSGSASADASRSSSRRDARSVLRSASTAAASSRQRPRTARPSSSEAASLQTPWLGLFGDLDKGIPVEDVEELRGALGGAPVDTEVVRYADAEHGFHCDARDAYHEDSAKDAWQRTLDWFATHLG